MTATSPPRVGFVLEQSLGHVTHSANLRSILPSERAIDCEIAEIPFHVDGIAARLPVYRSNWTVRSGWRARRAIAAMHRRRPLDALFVHTQVPAVLVPDWLGRIPSVVSLDATPLQYDELGEHYDHAAGDGRAEQWKWRANRRCFERARRIVTWSAWAKAGVVDGYGIPEDKIVVIPPGVDPSSWHRTGSTTGDGVVRILFVGGDLQRKGGDLLLRAFAELRTELALDPDSPDVELHLVTSAPVPDAPGVHAHAGLRPNSPTLIALYHQADVFCLPTRADCLPMVLSEAGAAGLPLVATAVAGVPEIVQDGETGLVVPVDDLDALVKALRLLVERPDIRARLGAGARRLVDAQFDATVNARVLVDLLAEVSAEPGGSGR